MDVGAAADRSCAIFAGVWVPHARHLRGVRCALGYTVSSERKEEGGFMIEILWHGRGGQGAFTAARLLGATGSLADGRYALAFPSFGPERRGAPMRAFTKLADRPIGDRSAIARADYVVYLDETLFGDGWDAELKPGGRVLVNSERAFDDPRVVAVPANRISQEILGRPIPNTVFLGVLAQLIDAVSVDNAKEAVCLYMPAKLHAANERIIDEAARAQADGRFDAAAAAAGESAVAAAAEAGEAVAAAEGEAGVEGDKAGGAADANAVSAADASADDARLAALLAQAPGTDLRPKSAIPHLQNDALDPAQFARTTTFAAGHLVDRNAGWRNERPVVDFARCTGCLQCYMQCPDGAIFKLPAGWEPPVVPGAGDALEGGKRKAARVAVDYDFCKGCGVCVRACAFDAIALYDEPRCRAIEDAAARAQAATSGEVSR
jgi:pyruvate ferredoxin oxidoreductase gamma subunit